MITLQDLIERFGERELIQLTNEQPRHDSVIDAVVMQAAIADAVSEVASYLLSAGLVKVSATGEVTYLPSKQLPSTLKQKACDIARYYLYDNGVIEIVQTRYDVAIKWLDKVKKDPSMLIGQTKPPVNSDAVAVIPNTVPTIWDD